MQEEKPKLFKSCRKRNYDYESPLSEINPIENSLNSSFKKLKLENHETFQKILKKEPLNDKENVLFENHPFEEKAVSEYQTSNDLLRNSYLEYVLRWKEPETKLVFKKLPEDINQNDLPEKIYDFYKDEKMRLCFARMELNQRMQIE